MARHAHCAQLGHLTIPAQPLLISNFPSQSRALHNLQQAPLARDLDAETFTHATAAKRLSHVPASGYISTAPRTDDCTDMGGELQDAGASPGFEAALHASCAAHLLWGLARNPMRLPQRCCGCGESRVILACGHIDNALPHVFSCHIHPAQYPYGPLTKASMTEFAGHR